MGILFYAEAIENLTAEERATLTHLADKAQAPTVEEANKESKEEMSNYCKRLKEKAEAEAARAKALKESFVWCSSKFGAIYWGSPLTHKNYGYKKKKNKWWSWWNIDASKL